MNFTEPLEFDRAATESSGQPCAGIETKQAGEATGAGTTTLSLELDRPETGLVEVASSAQSVQTPAFAPDSVARGVLIILLLSGLQRLIGFVRAVWFCRYLPPEDLGQWEITFSFLNLAAPMVILSLPGTFGRYAEQYRRRGQLQSFLRETAWACAGLTIVAGLGLWWGRPWLNQLLFGGSGSAELLTLLPCTLASMITLNYLTELFTALRNVRISSILFFFNSVVFACLGLVLLAWWRTDAVSVVAAYGFANLLGAGVAGRILWRNYSALPTKTAAFDRAGLWGQLLPFTLAVWTINLVTNLFSVVDRYLIVHLAPGSATDALALVGQYHSGRLLPLLILSVVQMLGAMLLPYMTTEWESGRPDWAGLRLRLALKLLAFGMTTLGALALLAAPILFTTALGGKFQSGQDVLPGTLIYCTWFGLALVVQNYLWCAEKAWSVAIVLALGLGTNVLLNSLFLPRWGLEGVVLGTSLSHLLALGLMVGWAYRLGFRADGALVAMLVLPASLILGPGWTLLGLALVALIGLTSGTLLTTQEKELLRKGLAAPTDRWPRWIVRQSHLRIPEDRL